MYAVMGGERPRHVVEGMIHKHILSSGISAMPTDSDGVPFNCSHIYASGNLAADMYCNVAAESTGRTLAVRLYNSTSDPGMQKMLSYLIARDTMHQQQWLASSRKWDPTPCRSPTLSTKARKLASSATSSWVPSAAAPPLLQAAIARAHLSTAMGVSPSARSNPWANHRTLDPHGPIRPLRSNR